MITSFKDTCYIEILPHLQKSNRRKLLLNALISNSPFVLHNNNNACVGL